MVGTPCKACRLYICQVSLSLGEIATITTRVPASSGPNGHVKGMPRSGQRKVLALAQIARPDKDDKVEEALQTKKKSDAADSLNCWPMAS